MFFSSLKLNYRFRWGGHGVLTPAHFHTFTPAHLLVFSPAHFLPGTPAHFPTCSFFQALILWVFSLPPFFHNEGGMKTTRRPESP